MTDSAGNVYPGVLKSEFLVNHWLLWLRSVVISFSHCRVILTQRWNWTKPDVTSPYAFILHFLLPRSYKVRNLHICKNATWRPKNQALWTPGCSHVDIYLGSIRIKQRGNISLCRQATHIRTKLSVIIFREWGRSRESFVQKPTGVAACCERTKWWRDKLKTSLKGSQIAFS